jgi:spore coat protein H
MLRRAWLLGVLLAFACDEPSKSPGTRLGADAGAQSPAAGGDADAADASFTPPGSDAGGPDHAGADAGAVPDPSDALYQPDELLEVEITLDSADWETLRGEGRSIVDVISGCYLDDDFDYTMMPASVTVDGHRLEHVGVRKKGLLGSLAMQRPSLRVDFNEYEKDQNLFGEKTLTLNNSIQDRSYTHTCMAYAAFEAAGIAAPRCSFAHVSVNGEDLGVYVHVEAIKKPFIARRFGNDDGDLYEGALADFRPDRLAYFQKKTNEEEPLSPELVALSDALTKPDQELLAALAPLLDLDAFMRFWATEALVANGDSYSGNQNNFFIYVHPETRKISFIPWGPDGAYSVSDSFSGKEGQPKSV